MTGIERRERLDDAHYAMNLRLLFICSTRRFRRPSRSRWRCAWSALVGEADFPRVPGERGGDGATDHPRQAPDRRGRVPFETPGAPDRAERLAAVAAAIYSCSTKAILRRRRGSPAVPLCDEAIRLARLLLRLFSDEPSMMAFSH